MIKTWWHTSKTSSHYLPITISVMSWLMAFIQDRWFFKPSIKDVFIIIERLWKSSCKVCAATVKICAADIFCVCGCFWENFMFFKERATAYERKCAAASWKIFFVCGCFWEYFMFFKNVRLLLKDINVWMLLKENVQLLLRIMYVLLRNILKWKTA